VSANKVKVVFPDNTTKTVNCNEVNRVIERWRLDNFIHRVIALPDGSDNSKLYVKVWE
jgi:hypothetical protein